MMNWLIFTEQQQQVDSPLSGKLHELELNYLNISGTLIFFNLLVNHKDNQQGTTLEISAKEMSFVKHSDLLFFILYIQLIFSDLNTVGCEVRGLKDHFSLLLAFRERCSLGVPNAILIYFQQCAEVSFLSGRLDI